MNWAVKRCVRCLSTVARNEPFRNLSSFEQEAIRVIDNRDLTASSPVNHIFLTCEHASKEYFPLTSSLKYAIQKKRIDTLSREFRLYDPGAEECTLELSKAMKCISCICAISKAVVDVDGSLLSQKLYLQLRRTGYLMGIYNSHERAGLHYGLYHGVVREVMSWIHPKYHISVHTKALKGDMELVYKEQSVRSHRVVEVLKEGGVSAGCLISHEFNTGINRLIELAGDWQRPVKSFRVNVNEKLAKSKSRRQDLVAVLSTAFNQILTP
eukprot:TRINITY_DN3824_c0_g1_i11.p1 TRINITY_DN3824_c0_g1~~TRINITY_DN3824_c0_g1_i11.p1  ORF type:complete len:268 (-),score=46.67 TRINITY_DN3824_c0_g1_i11:580-1383(-)